MSANVSINRVLIIGLGVMGCSLANIASRFGYEVFGHDSRPIQDSIFQSKKSITLVPDVSDFLEHSEVDLIVLAMPTLGIFEWFDKLINLRNRFKKQFLLTEISSVKGPIFEYLNKQNSLNQDFKDIAPLKDFFISSHPMFGSEKSGSIALNLDSLAGIVVIVITDKIYDSKSMLLNSFWATLEAEVKYMSSDKAHDEAMVSVSHLPHLLVASYLSFLHESQKEGDLMFSGTGFRDFSRIGAANPDLWADIFTENRHLLLEKLREYIEFLRQWESKLVLESSDIDSLRQQLIKAQNMHHNYIKDSKEKSIVSDD